MPPVRAVAADPDAGLLRLRRVGQHTDQVRAIGRPIEDDGLGGVLGGEDAARGLGGQVVFEDSLTFVDLLHEIDAVAFGVPAYRQPGRDVADIIDLGGEQFMDLRRSVALGLVAQPAGVASRLTQEESTIGGIAASPAR